MSDFKAISSQTVGAAIRNVLPQGSVDTGGDDTSDLSWGICPHLPTDVFAVSAYLLKVGGVTSFFEPSPYADPRALPTCHFVLNIRLRGMLDRAAEEWRNPHRNDPGEPPKYVEKLWASLIDCWDMSVAPGGYISDAKRLGGDSKAPKWWSTATKLAMISDMACNRLLRDKVLDFEPSPFEEWITRWYFPKLSAPKTGDDATSSPVEHLPPASLCSMADSSVVCVLPKVRVSPVGATLRNVSRNLSLLPGRGEVRCSWHIPPRSQSEDLETLDILLIPEPSKIDAKYFVPRGNEEISSNELHYYKRNWENFGLNQGWICDEEGCEDSEKCAKFIDDCSALLKEARDQSRRVNGVILPELAVNYSVFNILCGKLKEVEPGLEFVVSGSSDNCDEMDRDKKGNHVLTRVWYEDDEYLTVSRKKHHRWRMDRSQIENYALSSVLNPKIRYWWEDTALGRREIHFHRFRKRSVFSVLICEELARSDPCHEILRSVAPNLIIALLLDGPQIRARWPYQYASNLADDPGSSVLTFTSFGLIDRSNRQGRYSKRASVAMWKDDTGKVVEIDMPAGKGMRGVLLSLWSEHVEDRTITGKNSLARSWRYSSHFPVILGNSDN